MQEISIWEDETFFCNQNVIITGSGFTGLWSALHLKLLHPHYRITILERGIIPTGASTRNAGFSCFGSPSELIADALEMGEENMWQLVSQRYNGLNEIRHFFADDEIEYIACGGYECFTKDAENWATCFNKLEWLNAGLNKITGEDQVFTVDDDKIAEFGFAGFDHIIANKLEGALHPGKLVKALLHKVQALGVQVLTNIEVMHYHETDNEVKVFTNTGITFITNQLLLCTNAFTGQLVAGIDIIPNRGQVLITGPIENLALRGTFHFDRGYYYFRNLGNRLLLGGARNTAFDEEHTQTMQSTTAIQQELENFITEHILPNTPFCITGRWTGIMAMGTEKSPIVKALGKNIFCCVRMSGMGVALAPVAAKDIVNLMNKTVL